MTDIIYVNQQQRIGGGGDSEVYQIQPDLAVKMHFERETAEKEYSIQTHLFSSGISVPRPRTELLNIYFHGLILRGFGMDFKEHNWREYSEEAELQRLQEIEKAKELGYIPDDECRRHNCLWVPKEKKVYLIDFARWKIEKGVRQ